MDEAAAPAGDEWDPFGDFDLDEAERMEDWAAFIEDVNIREANRLQEESTATREDASTKIRGSRLYVSVVSVEGVSESSKTKKSSQQLYSVKCSLSDDASIILLAANELEQNLTPSTSTLPGFDVFQFYGQTELKLKLMRKEDDKSWLTALKRLFNYGAPEEMASASLTLSQIIAASASCAKQRLSWGFPIKLHLNNHQQQQQQQQPPQSQSQDDLGGNPSSFWGSMRRGRSQPSDRSKRGNNSRSIRKLVSYMSLRTSASANAATLSTASTSTTNQPMPPPINIMLQVHLLPLQHCLDLTVDASDSAVLRRCESLRRSIDLEFSKMNSGGQDRCAFTELHAAAASGCRELVEDLLATLALNKKIATSLAVRSIPSSLSVLEVALLSGSHSVVRSLLSRAGNLCFQGSISIHPRGAQTSAVHTTGNFTAVHAAILGGSVECLSLLLRFIDKHGHVIIGLEKINGAMPSVDVTSRLPIPPPLPPPVAPIPAAQLEAPLQPLQPLQPPLPPDLQQPMMEQRNDVPLAVPVAGARPEHLLSWPDERGLPPVSFLCSLANRPAEMSALQQVALLNVLISAGCNVGPQGVQRGTAKTPLMIASESEHLALVDRLITEMSVAPIADGPAERARAECFTTSQALAYECAPYARDTRGWTALCYAISAKNEAITRLLLSYTFAITPTTNDGETLFHLCAAAGNMTICEMLLSREAYEWKEHLLKFAGAFAVQTRQHRDRLVGVRDGRGRMAETVARAHGHDEIASALHSALSSIYSANETASATATATASATATATATNAENEDDDDTESWLERTAIENENYDFALPTRPRQLGYYSRLTKDETASPTLPTPSVPVP